MVEARERTLPLVDAFAALFPGGMVQRGMTVGCTGPAAVSLAMAVAAGPVCAGSWTAVAGLPALGLRAITELGVAVDRLVLVAEPPDGLDAGRWADAVAAMIDGFDVVVLGPRLRVRSAVARRLQSRAQSRGAVLVTAGVLDGFGCDLQLASGAQQWEGLGEGHGVATARRVEVELRGRRMPRPLRSVLWLPDAAGVLRAETNEAGITRLARTG